MKMNKPNKSFALAIASAVLFCTLVVDSADARSGKPPTNRTGAPGHSTCAGCHTSAGTGNVSLDFSGFGEYEPSQIYSMMVTVADLGKFRFGFSMVARDADNNTADVGSWSAGSADTQVHGTAGSHASHKNAPFEADAHTFTVNWTAPATGAGDVTFYVAAVGANGNGSKGAGDVTYTKTLTVTELVAMNVAPVVAGVDGILHATTGFEIPIGGVSISDDDAGGGDLTVTLSVNSGALNVSASIPGGIASGDITGNGSPSVTMEGALAELNATFGDAAGIRYHSDPNFVGTDTLNISANDNGNTGPGGAQTGEAGISIMVNPPPSLSNQRFLGNGDFALTLNGVPGLTYTVERSEDLDVWVIHEQVVLVGATAEIVDSGASGFSSRFYRALESQP